jgi:nitroreductase
MDKEERMDVLEAIMTRRSIRSYTGEPVSDQDLETILKAGSQAPSAMNHQPWHFVVVKDRDHLASIAEAHLYAKMLPQAGCAVIVCGDKERQNMTGFLIEDCSAAIQNMLLAAHGIGLGAVWCGLYPNTQLTQPLAALLLIPDRIVLVGMVVVGHKAEDKPAEDRFLPERVHQEKW